MKLFYSLIFLLLICVVCVSATPVLQGSCTLASICNVTASYPNGSESYYAELQGCAINTLYANGNRTFNLANGGSASSTTAIGQVFTSVQRLYPNLTSTIASNSSGDGFIRVNCSATNDGVKNDWYFYDTYINLTSTANVSFYVANYLRNVVGQGNLTVYNSSSVYPTSSGLVNYNITGGLVSATFPDVNNYSLLFKFDNSVATTIGIRSVQGGPPTLGIGRGNNVPANTLFNLSIKVLPRDLTQSESNSYTYPLRKFGYNLFYGDSLCEWGGFDNFIINNTVCNITHGFNLAKYNFTISNSTVFINKTTIPLNFTTRLFNLISLVWFKTI